MSSKKQLEVLRDQIDEIDGKLLDLLNLRAGVALKVSEFKQKNAFEATPAIRCSPPPNKWRCGSRAPSIKTSTVSR